MSSSGTAAGKPKGAAKWQPIAVLPPKGTGRLWVYCPAFPFIKVGQTSADMLKFCIDATHWHPVIEGATRPEPPQKEVDKTGITLLG